MIPVSVAGCAGRMGRRILWAVLHESGLSLHSAFEAHGHPLIGRDAGALAGLTDAGVAVASSVEAARGSRVLIDFTAPEASERHLRFCAEHEIALVLATTGFSDAQKALVHETARRVPVVYAPNMGIGVNVILGLVRQAARILGSEFDIEVIEAHHNQKKDAPSGTAFGLAEAAAEGRKLRLAESAVYGRHGTPGARKPSEIGIHAIRGGDIVGEHTVLFAGPGEKIEISHSALSRDIFAHGAVRASLFAAGRAPGLYDMQDVLGLK